MEFRFTLIILFMVFQALHGQSDACTLPASDGWTVTVEGDNNGAIIQSEELSIETIEECVNCEFYVDNTIFIVNGRLRSREQSDRTNLRPIPKLRQPDMAMEMITSLDNKDQGDCLKDLLRDQVKVNKYTVYELVPGPEEVDQIPTTVLAVSVSATTLMDYGLKVEFPINGGIQRIWELGRHYFRKDGKCLGQNPYNENLCMEYDFATDFIGKYAVIGEKTPKLKYSIIDRSGKLIIGGLTGHKIINYTNGGPAGFMVTNAAGKKAYYRKNGDSTKFYSNITFGSPFIKINDSKEGARKYTHDFGHGLVSASTLKEVLPPIHETNSFTFAGDEYIGANVDRQFDHAGFAVYKYDKKKETVRKVFEAEYSKGKISLVESEHIVSINIDPPSGPDEVALIDLRSEKLYGPVIGESFINKTQNVIRIKEKYYSNHRLYSALTLEHLVTVDDQILPKARESDIKQDYRFYKKNKKHYVIVDIVAGKVLHDNVLAVKKNDGDFILAKGVAKKDQISLLSLGTDGKSVLIANHKLKKGTNNAPSWQKNDWGINLSSPSPGLTCIDLREGENYFRHIKGNYIFVLNGRKKIWSVKDDTTKSSLIVSKLSEDVFLLKHAAQYEKGETYGPKNYVIELFAESKHIRTLPYQKATTPSPIYPTRIVTDIKSNHQNILLPDGSLHFKDNQPRIRYAYQQDTCVSPNSNLTLVLGVDKKERFYDLAKKTYSTSEYKTIAPFKCAELTYGSFGYESVQFIDAEGKKRSPKLFFEVDDMRDFGTKTYAIIKKRISSYRRYGIYEVSRNATLLPPNDIVSDIIFSENGLTLSGRQNERPYKKWTASLLIREDLPVPECISGDCAIYRKLLIAGRN